MRIFDLHFRFTIWVLTIFFITTILSLILLCRTVPDVCMWKFALQPTCVQYRLFGRHILICKYLFEIRTFDFRVHTCIWTYARDHDCIPTYSFAKHSLWNDVIYYTTTWSEYSTPSEGVIQPEEIIPPLTINLFFMRIKKQNMRGILNIYPLNEKYFCLSPYINEKYCFKLILRLKR